MSVCLSVRFTLLFSNFWALLLLPHRMRLFSRVSGLVYIRFELKFYFQRIKFRGRVIHKFDITNFFDHLVAWINSNEIRAWQYFIIQYFKKWAQEKYCQYGVLSWTPIIDKSVSWVLDMEWPRLLLLYKISPQIRVYATLDATLLRWLLKMPRST